MFNQNLLLSPDSYKHSHPFQLPPGATRAYSYIESRGGRFDHVLFFGLQMFLCKLERGFSYRDIRAAEEILALHGMPFDAAAWRSMHRKHNGRLPISIKALKEGTRVPIGCMMTSIENTDPEFRWLAQFLESPLLRAVWYPTTVAATSFEAKRLIASALRQTSDNADAVLPFMLHDFGARGVSSAESAAIGGVAHLVNFKGSDTLEAVVAAREFYSERMAGFSIPAAEHFTITSWGQDNEGAAYRNMLEKFGKPGAKFAVVSDSYDLMHAVNNIWGGDLHHDVMNSGATLIVRPDSGDPTTIPIDVVEALSKRFGCTVNSKGFKVLPDCVRVIQGDGITIETIPTIIANMKAAGFSLENLAFGMGGGLLQQVNRDTQQFAQKCSAIQIDGKWQDVFKQPKTDPRKNSKRGKLKVIWDEDASDLVTVRQDSSERPDQMIEVFRDGEILVHHTLSDIRDRADAALLAAGENL